MIAGVKYTPNIQIVNTKELSSGQEGFTSEISIELG